VKTKIIEVVEASGFNYGKFLVGQFDHEWERTQLVSSPELLAMTRPLLPVIGISSGVLFVMDLQTGEGALFRPFFDLDGIYAHRDLEKHQIWCCPMYEPFLKWLYRQLPRDLENIAELPDLVDLGDVPTAFRGYRREGPKEAKP
jgi:hypothetical protein